MPKLAASLAWMQLGFRSRLRNEARMGLRVSGTKWCSGLELAGLLHTLFCKGKNAESKS